MTWPTKKLGEVCAINMGQSPSSSTYNDNKNGLPFYQGKKDYGKLYPTPRVWCSEPTKIVEAGDILISVRAPVGALNIAQEKSCIGRGLTGLRAKKELDQDFLFNFLKLKEKDIANLGTGSTFTAISKKHLENIEIPFPPLYEQRKIVAKLEKLLAKTKESKRLRTEAQEATQNLLSAELHKIFKEGKKRGWKEKELGEICELNPKKSEIRNEPDELLVSFVPMKAVDEYAQAITYSDDRELGLARYGYTYFRNGDIVLAKITPCMENGKIAIAKNLKNGIGFGTTEFHVIRAGKDVLPEWIYYILRQPFFREEAQQKMTGSAGQKRVPVQFLEKYKISLPSLAEQKKIVARLDELSGKIRQLQEYQKSTQSDLEKLEQSILHSAFQGK
ncbi:MAG: restriction endonuclease subunit S [Parcubacteria group bacterium]|jgi:type I restriction enzyme S subunit